MVMSYFFLLQLWSFLLASSLLCGLKGSLKTHFQGFLKAMYVVRSQATMKMGNNFRSYLTSFWKQSLALLSTRQVGMEKWSTKPSCWKTVMDFSLGWSCPGKVVTKHVVRDSVDSLDMDLVQHCLCPLWSFLPWRTCESSRSLRSKKQANQPASWPTRKQTSKRKKKKNQVRQSMTKTAKSTEATKGHQKAKRSRKSFRTTSHQTLIDNDCSCPAQKKVRVEPTRLGLGGFGAKILAVGVLPMGILHKLHQNLENWISLVKKMVCGHACHVLRSIGQKRGYRVLIYSENGVAAKPTLNPCKSAHSRCERHCKRHREQTPKALQ